MNEETGKKVNTAIAFLLYCFDIDRIKALHDQSKKHWLEMSVDDIQFDPDNRDEPNDHVHVEGVATAEGSLVKNSGAITFVGREVELPEEEIEMGRAVRVGRFILLAQSLYRLSYTETWRQRWG